MTQTATGFQALAAVHPHHAALIREHTDARRVGTVVRINAPRGGTEGFYSGLLDGDLATITSATEATGGVSVQHIGGDTPHLSVRPDDTRVAFDVVDPADWTRDQALAAQRTAERGATAMLERAYTSANRLLGAPATDQAALEALREAHALRGYAFACGVLARA